MFSCLYHVSGMIAQLLQTAGQPSNRWDTIFQVECKQLQGLITLPGVGFHYFPLSLLHQSKYWGIFLASTHSLSKVSVTGDASLSWYATRQLHQLTRWQEGLYHCRLPRCMGPSQPSITALEAHVNMSHMTRIPLTCPVRGMLLPSDPRLKSSTINDSTGCAEVSLRQNYLENHFRTVHPGIVGIERLKTLWLPNRPSASPSVPPIPSEPVYSYAISSPHVSVARRSNQPLVSRPLGRKWSRLDAQDDEESEPTQIIFSDLPTLDKSSLFQLRDFVIRRKPLESDLWVARPPAMPAMPVHSNTPPLSILFESFARRVDEIDEANLELLSQT